MTVWVSRDKIDDSGSVGIWINQPPVKYKKGGYYEDHHEDCSLLWTGSPKEFKREFGFTPRKGELRKEKLIMEL